MSKLEVITGPMFSGKSEELIRRTNTAIYGDKTILILKPIADTRFVQDKIIMRKKNFQSGAFEPFLEFDAHQVGTREEAENLIRNHEPGFLAFDEAQFFGDWIVDLIYDLLNTSHEIIPSGFSSRQIVVAGLDMNFKGEPFGIMPRIMAMADSVIKLQAVCFMCKGKHGPAVLSKKIAGTQNEIEIGDSEKYEARCRICFSK